MSNFNGEIKRDYLGLARYQGPIHMDDIAKDLLHHRFIYIKALGSSGRLVLARDISLQNKLVVVNLIDRGPWIRENCLPLGRMLENQATLLHPLMIGCYETFLTPKFFCIVTEFAEGGDLDSFLKSQPGERLTEASARSVFQQTIIALEYIQKRGISIGNFNLKNLFLDSMPSLDPAVKSPHLKFHFGGVDDCTSSGFPDENEVSIDELIFQTTAFSDEVFAAGVMLHQLLTGVYPYTQNERKNSSSSILQADSLLSQDLQCLIDQMLHVDPTKRPSLQEIMHNSWFQQDLPPEAMHINDVWLSIAPFVDEKTNSTSVPDALYTMIEKAKTVGNHDDPVLSIEFPCRIWLKKDLQMAETHRQRQLVCKNGDVVDNYCPAISTISSADAHSLNTSVSQDNEEEDDDDGFGISGENMM